MGDATTTTLWAAQQVRLEAVKIYVDSAECFPDTVTEFKCIEDLAKYILEGTIPEES